MPVTTKNHDIFEHLTSDSRHDAHRKKGASHMNANSFAPGDILEVQELHFNPEKPVYKKVTVSMFSTATYLVVCDEHGNQWCIRDGKEIRKP